jgi:hypothetical protein
MFDVAGLQPRTWLTNLLLDEKSEVRLSLQAAKTRVLKLLAE